MRLLSHGILDCTYEDCDANWWVALGNGIALLTQDITGALTARSTERVATGNRHVGEEKNTVKQE